MCLLRNKSLSFPENRSSEVAIPWFHIRCNVGMGAKVHTESYSRLFNSMRDPNEDSNSSSWSHFYIDKPAPFLQYNNGYIHRASADNLEGNERDALKQKMLEHEAVFKNQVCELHRLYQIQRNMMEEVKRKEVHIWRPSTEPASSSSCFRGPQLNNNTAASCHWNSSSNGHSKEEFVALNGRPLKVRKTFDLRLPADGYIDIKDEDEGIKETNGPENGGKKFRVDLNAPVKVEGTSTHPVNFLDLTSENNTERSKAPAFINGFDSKIHNRERQLLHTYEAGFSRSQSDQQDRYPFLSHIRHGIPNQDHLRRSCYSKEEERWRGGLRYNLDFSSGRSDNGYFASASAAQTPPFPFLSSFPSLQAPSNGFGHFYPVGVMNPAARDQDRFVRKTFAANSSSCRINQDESNSNGFDMQRANPAPTVLFCRDRKSAAVAFDLNKEVPSSPSDDVVILEEEHEPVLPWLRKSKRSCVNEVSSNGKGDLDVEMKSFNKIMGFSIFGRDSGKTELASTSAGHEGGGTRGEIRMIDINVACDPDEDATTEEHTGIRDYIDLNSCATDYEGQEEKKNSGARKMLEIDLEAPYVPKCDSQQVEDEALRAAAEVVLGVSSWYPKTQMNEDNEALLAESLLLFANAVMESETSIRNQNTAISSSDMDEFEVMTLQLEDAKDEHYKPKPHALDSEDAGDAANGTTNRPRRGQSRRGRQRRDFQRDILPGLASLSRHEVTEDLQVFGGVMRAMGHCWSPGSTRRNGGGRGRKRMTVETVTGYVPTPLVQQLSNMESGCLEDRNSLAGWGKTPRRPRRQRCPQGNTSSVL